MQQRRPSLFIAGIFPVISVAVMSMTLAAQTPASARVPDPAMAPGTTQTESQPAAAIDTASPQQTQRAPQIQATGLTAEFTKSIDTKKAKTGDEIAARTTSDAKLPSGAALPKGTKLVGNVVEVTPKSKEQKNSHIVISLNRAVTKDGKDLPIHAAVTSMTVPSAPQSMDMPAPTSGGSGGMTPSSSGGASSAGSGSTPAASTSQSMPASSMSADASTQQQGAMLKSAQDHVAVGNMPRVMLSAPTTPESAGVLDAQNENISLQSGTQFTVNVSPAQGSQ